jgi:hypothetical protein
MVTVTLPKSSRPTSNRIIDPPFCLKRKARANPRAFPIEAQVLLSELALPILHRKGLRFQSAPIGAEFSD